MPKEKTSRELTALFIIMVMICFFAAVLIIAGTIQGIPGHHRSGHLPPKTKVSRHENEKPEKSPSSGKEYVLYAQVSGQSAEVIKTFRIRGTVREKPSNAGYRYIYTIARGSTIIVSDAGVTYQHEGITENFTGNSGVCLKSTWNRS